EGGKEREGAAGKDAALDLEAEEEGADDHSLRHGCDQRAVEEDMIPEGLVLDIAKAELEGDAAKHQRQQHDQDREIKRRDKDSEGKWKGREQCDAAQHQPGLV